LDPHAERSLARLLPRLEARFASGAGPAAWDTFKARLEAHFGALCPLLLHLYGDHYDFFYHLERLLCVAAERWLARPPELQALDNQREADPAWFQSERMLGGVLYVDLFAGDLEGVRARIPYFKELGLTYLHLMPLFLSPEGNSDGGYAVSSYREVNPALGTMPQLADLAAELRHHGISLVLDFVLNHTSDEHVWARRAIAGEQEYREYYLMFPDRAVPDAYQAALREIFPDQRPGNFTWRADLGKWVWTTFNSFQWDLNYANPAVFTQMLEEMLFLANQGIEVLRFDAVAFVWKRLGTNCENLPEVHMLIRAFNLLARIAAPSLLFKSEAIVHPRDVNAYISPDECQLSYNPLLMALLWNTLATRDVRLLRDSMQASFKIDPDCAWVNYVRVHDDIGWTFDDELAGRLGTDGYGHRRFLNDFFTGRFPGSFARGLPFGENPSTGDARISGTGASLAGLERATQVGDGSFCCIRLYLV
jgi:amylosucrase